MADHIVIGDIAPRVRYTADGAQTDFTYPFPIFENADIEVYEDTSKKTLDVDYSVSGAGSSSGGAVSFTTAPAASVAVTLVRRLTIERTADFQESGEFRAKVINDELDFQAAATQQVADDVGRSIRLTAFDAAANLELPDKPTRTNKALAFDAAGDLAVSSRDIGDIEAGAVSAAASATAAVASATAAAGSATAASTSASAAATSEINAAASAASAAAVVDGVNWRDVVNKTATFGVQTTEGGYLFNVDTSAGPVTVNLPSIAALSGTFSVSVRKTSSDANAVTVTPNGTDTVGGGADFGLAGQGDAVTVISDETATPDDWAVLEFGAAVPDGTITPAKLSDAAKPYDIAFAAGFDNTMTAVDVAVRTYGELVVPRAVTLTGEAGYIDTAGAGAAVVVDVEKNGASVYSTKPKFAAAANALTAGTLSTTALASGDRLTFKVTQVGSSTAGSGLRFTLKAKLA